MVITMDSVLPSSCECASATVSSINHLVQGEYRYGWRRGFFWGSTVSTGGTLVLWVLYHLFS